MARTTAAIASAALFQVAAAVGGAEPVQVPTGQVTRVVRPLQTELSIPAGRFLMGASAEAQAAAVELCAADGGRAQDRMCRAEAFEGEGPARQVFLSAFSIDRVEVSVAAYRSCARAGACDPGPLLQRDPRLLEPELPITQVTWGEAQRYCAWRGARLPSEAEWERAARGRDGRPWPWGKISRSGHDNHGRFSGPEDPGGALTGVIRPDPSDGWALLAPVGSYPQGASPEGILDLAGNVAEWTADVYDEAPPQRAAVVNPRGPALGPMRAVRGGSWRQPRVYQRSTARSSAPPATRSAEIGFRCAR